MNIGRMVVAQIIIYKNPSRSKPIIEKLDATDPTVFLTQNDSSKTVTISGANLYKQNYSCKFLVIRCSQIILIILTKIFKFKIIYDKESL